MIFLILNALSFKFKIYKSVEREEGNHLGTVYFAIAITAVMTLAYFFPVLYYPSGVAAFCLTFGDGFAALMGYNFPSKKLRGGKSMLGFLSCFGASVLCLVAFKLLYWQELTFSAICIIAAMAAISELVDKGLDNFTVTFVTFGLSYLLVQDPALSWGLGLAAAIFFLVYLSKSITYGGALLSMVVVFCFTYFGGAIGITFLLMNYFSIFIIGLVRRKRVSKEKHGRGFLQILINGGLGTVLVVLYGLTGKAFLLASAMLSIGGNFIDSVSSDVGTLSKQEPYDLLRREFVPIGLSGGVTLLGTVSAFLFSAGIGIYVALTLKQGLLFGLLCTALVFAQSALDTLLGSAIQVKFRCTGCGILTEAAHHCDAPTEYARGWRFMNNNAVNTVSSLLISALAAALTGVLM